MTQGRAEPLEPLPPGYVVPVEVWVEATAGMPHAPGGGAPDTFCTYALGRELKVSPPAPPFPVLTGQVSSLPPY